MWSHVLGLERIHSCIGLQDLCQEVGYPMMALLFILVFISSAGIDFANTRYVRAVGELAVNRAACWSLLQWAMSLIGFLFVIKVSLWLLIPEGLGLFFGSWISLRLYLTSQASDTK